MRADLAAQLGRSISGTAYISEIRSEYVMLKGIHTSQGIEVDHCWVKRAPLMIYIYLGQKIAFRAKVMIYYKKKGWKRVVEFGIEIEEWQEIA